MKNLMKAILVVGSFVAMTNAALAQTDTCETVSKIATSVMDNRQSGVPLSKMMEIVRAVEKTPVGPIAKTMTIDAYEQPRFNTKDMQKRMIGDFADKYTLICEKARTNKK
jgi:hypothetical protein